MQAGRWFGFRHGYKDLVRLFIRRDATVDLYTAFEALLMDEEAFRAELIQYEGFDEETGRPLTLPRQIPPLVSQHLPWLRPTARNKMWNAVLQSRATGGRIQDLYGLPERANRVNNGHNLDEVGVRLAVAASSPCSLNYRLVDGSTGKVDAKIGLLNGEDFLELFDKLRWHPEYEGVVKPIRRFIATATGSGRIEDWAVVWPQPQKVIGHVTIANVGLAPIITRKRRDGGRIDFIGSDAKHRAAVEPIAAGQEASSLPASPSRGVVLLYLADDRAVDLATGQKLGDLTIDHVVPLIAIATPSAASPQGSGVAQWGVIVQARADDPTVDKNEVGRTD
jgi:hypothetical protein